MNAKTEKRKRRELLAEVSKKGYKMAKFFSKDTGELTQEGIVKQTYYTHDNKKILPSGLVVALDPSEVEVEIYNRMDEEIMFKEMRHPFRVILCQARNFALLPHQNFTGHTKSGRPCDCIINFGDLKFKGNSRPSRPEVKKIIK